MSELTPDIAADVIAACQAGAEEAAGALSRALDTELTITVGEAATYDPASPPSGFEGPGLAIVMTFGDIGAVAVIPAQGGLLPDWLKAPDATGESKLSTLAQELSMLLVPETFMADDFKAAWVEDLKSALAAGEVSEGAGLAPLSLTGGEQTGSLSLVWPCSAPGTVLPLAEETADPPAEAAPESPAVAKTVAPRRKITDLTQLPNYSRSLLRVEVPVTVCLATKKLPVGEIVDLVPGAIITFDKLCDDLIELTVGEEAIALGEAVKVGEKFGLQVTEMILPDEKFQAVRREAG